MEIVLDVQDKNYDAFIEFIKTLDYVSVKNDDEIPQWQMNEVEKRLQDHKNNPDLAIDFDTAIYDIEKDL